MLFTGVCHTDSYTLSGSDPEGAFPVVLGHEGGGVVESVGPGVASVQPGEYLVVFSLTCWCTWLCVYVSDLAQLTLFYVCEL